MSEQGQAKGLESVFCLNLSHDGNDGSKYILYHNGNLSKI